MNTSTARIGYARVSTSDQNHAAQVAALEAAGCTMIRTETGSGTSLENRPELGIILDFIHPGETLVVTRIDRLARSMKDLQVIVAKLRERGANIAATEQPVDTSTAAGKAFFDLLGIFAEFETKPAPRAAGRRNRRGEAEGCLSRTASDDRHGQNKGQTCRRAVADQNRARDGNLARNRLQGQGQDRRAWQSR